MGDVSALERSPFASFAAMRARLATYTPPEWARNGRTQPRSLARELARGMSLDLLPFTLAPEALTVAMLWAAGDVVRVASAVLVAEALALAHAGLSLVAGSFRSPIASASPADDRDVSPGVYVAVARMVGGLLLGVCCVVVAPFVVSAGPPFVLILIGALAIYALALTLPLTRVGRLGVEAFYALAGVASGPAIAVAVAVTQRQRAPTSLLVLTGALGLFFGVSLALRWSHRIQVVGNSEPGSTRDVERYAFAAALLVSLAVAGVVGLTWRPLEGALLGVLALPLVLVGVTGVARARGDRATWVAMASVVRAYWLLAAWILVGLLGAGALHRWLA